ncbi:MAG: hypothetical protein N2444_06170 [Methylocystis sp.]|nr:hypothetical protein [Methylocystis sp.]
MAMSPESPFASRLSRKVLGVTVAACAFAAFAAAPSAKMLQGPSASPTVTAAVSLNDDGMRPLARGAAIRVSNAYGADDEDCTTVIIPMADQKGRMRYERSVTCSN